MLYLDGHVHIQTRFNLDLFLHHALINFQKQSGSSETSSPHSYFLLLSEARDLNCFSSIQQEMRQRTGLLPSSWRISGTREEESLLLQHENQPDTQLFLVAGRQIVTAERLEVLALATAAKIPDHLPVKETIEEVRSRNGMAVLPWGAGKWMGKRGAIVRELLSTLDNNMLFVGDNGGRPTLWKSPDAFDQAAKRGIRLLPGSDPLSLAGEEMRAGSYGAAIEGQCSPETPAADLRGMLSNPQLLLQPYGRQMGFFRFLKNQISLRLTK